LRNILIVNPFGEYLNFPTPAYPHAEGQWQVYGPDRLHLLPAAVSEGSEEEGDEITGEQVNTSNVILLIMKSHTT